MKKHRLLILLITLLFTQCQFYQNLPKADEDNSSNTTERYSDNNYRSSSLGGYPPGAQPGKCYAKCMIHNEGEDKKFTEWRDVLCPGQVTQHIVHQVQNALRTEGYYEGTNSSTMDKEVKDALVKFQKDNGLPMGSLDFDTLDILGIRY